MHAPGLFGKLPSLGDFVGRGFSPELRDALDRLLQAALTAAYAEGGAQGLETQAPPIALALRPGAVARSGFSGCIVPSVDKVGRFFPLCVGIETPPDGSIPLNWVSLTLATELCRQAFEAQAARSGPDELLRRLPDQEAWHRLMWADIPFRAALEFTVPPMRIETTQLAFAGPESRMGAHDQALCSQLPLKAQAIGAVVDPGAQFSLFFADRSLLSWSAFAALFDGRWVHWGWAWRETVVDPDDDDGFDTIAPMLRADDDTAPGASSLIKRKD